MPVHAPESFEGKVSRVNQSRAAGTWRDHPTFSPLFTWMGIRNKCFTGPGGSLCLASLAVYLLTHGN